MEDNEPFLAERMSLTQGDNKFTFLKGYGEFKHPVLVITQHMRTGETKAEHFPYDKLEHYFGPASKQIISYLNRPIPTYKPK